MPTYLYKCTTHNEFEEEHSIKIKLEFCPKCAQEGKNDVKIERLINCVSKGVVELYGQDLVNKLKQDVKQLKTDMHKSDKIYSNLLGDTKYENLQRKMDAHKKK